MVPESLLLALCFVESSNRPDIIVHDKNGHNSIGYCQIQLRTAKEMGYKGNEKGLLDKRVNLFYSRRYLNYMYYRCGTFTGAIAAFNLGHCSNNPTNSKYALKVLSKWTNSLN